MILRNGKRTWRKTIYQELDEFRVKCGIHMKFIDEHFDMDPGIDLQIHLSKMLTYITRHQSKVIRLIETFESMYLFIDSLSSMVEAFHQELLLSEMMFMNDDIRLMTSSQWKFSYIMAQRCDVMLRDIEKFKDKVLPRFQSHIKYVKERKKIFLIIYVLKNEYRYTASYFTVHLC